MHTGRSRWLPLGRVATERCRIRMIWTWTVWQRSFFAPSLTPISSERGEELSGRSGGDFHYGR